VCVVSVGLSAVVPSVFFPLAAPSFRQAAEETKAMQLINWSAGESCPILFYGVVLCRVHSGCI
jgi:hypothetical protein